MAFGGAGREEGRQKRKEGRKERLGSGCILSEKKKTEVCAASVYNVVVRRTMVKIRP